MSENVFLSVKECCFGLPSVFSIFIIIMNDQMKQKQFPAVQSYHWQFSFKQNTSYLSNAPLCQVWRTTFSPRFESLSSRSIVRVTSSLYHENLNPEEITIESQKFFY